jgi:hypothetical protein
MNANISADYGFSFDSHKLFNNMMNGYNTSKPISFDPYSTNLIQYQPRLFQLDEPKVVWRRMLNIIIKSRSFYEKHVLFATALGNLTDSVSDLLMEDMRNHTDLSAALLTECQAQFCTVAGLSSVWDVTWQVIPYLSPIECVDFGVLPDVFVPLQTRQGGWEPCPT